MSNTKDMSQTGRLFRINSDGSNLIDLNIVTTSQINVVNNQIYYGQKDGLYMADIDSNGKVQYNKICIIHPYEINVLNNTIYFTDSGGIKKTKIYSSDIKGANIHKIYEGGWIDNLYVIGNYIFFEEGIKNSKMKVIMSNGKELQIFIKY